MLSCVVFIMFGAGGGGAVGGCLDSVWIVSIIRKHPVDGRSNSHRAMMKKIEWRIFKKECKEKIDQYIMILSSLRNWGVTSAFMR